MDDEERSDDGAGKLTGAFASSLESRLQDRSDILEELHLEAAIDAQLTVVGGAGTNARPVILSRDENNGQILFEDYTNPNAVANILSPFVPTAAERIQAFVSWIQLAPFDDHDGDILLDLGCGDGRVCIAAAKISGRAYRAIWRIFLSCDCLKAVC